MIIEAVESGFIDDIDVVTILAALLKQLTQSVPIDGRSDVDFYMKEG